MSIARTSAEEYVKEKLERFKGKKIEELVEAVMKEHNYILQDLVSKKLGTEFTQKEILMMMVDKFDLPPNEVVEVIAHIAAKNKLEVVIYTPAMFDRIMTELGVRVARSTNN